MNNCPHCYKDMKLDTDFMYERDMFADENTGEFNCPLCDEPVFWKSFMVIDHQYETDKDFL